LLFAGRIQPLKGLKIASEVFKNVKSENPNAGFLIVGGPSGHNGYDELDAAVRFLDDNSLLDSVKFMSPQPHEILSTAYRASDFCLVPSSSESFGLVALEAMACGSVVIANAVGGLNSLIVNNYNGYLMNNRNPKAWGDKVTKTFYQSELRRRLTNNAVAMSKSYTWRSSATKFIEMASRLQDSILVNCN
jgi:D-inositol-3-phosphate glycosyltransferase